MSQLSAEALLVQLGYNPNSSILSNLKQIIAKTPGFEEIQKHIITLNDKLKPYGAFIGFSNSSNYLKIKTNHASIAAEQEIEAWAQKYKVALIKSYDHYYIAGKEA